MTDRLSRRNLMGVAGMAAAAGLAGMRTFADAAEVGVAQAPGGKFKIVGVACSPRKGKTTAAGLNVCLEAARNADPRVETELIELAGLDIPVFDPASPGSDDFKKIAAKLSASDVAGIIVGTPVYFSGMTSLCKAFLDQCMAFRRNDFALGNKIGGVLAVGGARNGGQELAIAGVQPALMCQGMIVVGDGRPSSHTGATLVNTNDDISGDEFGLKTARNLGARVAQVAAVGHASAGGR